MSETTTPMADLRDDGPRLIARFERSVKHPPEKVWRAITESEHLHHWFPCDLVGELATGATVEVVFWPEVVEEHGIETPVLTGRILTYEPATCFEWSWEEDVIRFDLAPNADGTKITLTVALADHHADGSTGYHVCVDALVADLDGHPILHRKHDGALELRYRDAIDALRAGATA